jgi:hypothetical protein
MVIEEGGHRFSSGDEKETVSDPSGGFEMDNLRGILCLVGVVALCACGTPDEFDDQMEFRDTFVSSGGWLGNGIEDPDVSDIDPAYALDSSDALPNAEDWLLDPETLQLATYLVECALPANDSITRVVDGQTIELGGLLGLAPEWKTGACDEDCQEWVSACLLARTNVSGETVSIWVTGAHEALAPQPPAGALLEAGFFGNLFADPEGKYLCKGSHDAVVAARREGRTCSTSGRCDFKRYHDCTQHSRCEMTGPNQDIPSDCKTGRHATSAPYHTLVTYVVP